MLFTQCFSASYHTNYLVSKVQLSAVFCDACSGTSVDGDGKSPQLIRESLLELDSSSSESSSRCKVFGSSLDSIAHACWDLLNMLQEVVT